MKPSATTSGSMLGTDANVGPVIHSDLEILNSDRDVLGPLHPDRRTLSKRDNNKKTATKYIDYALNS